MSEEKGRRHVVIVETSAVIREGLTRILSDVFRQMEVVHLSSFKEIESYGDKRDVALLIVNPVLLAGCFNSAIHTLETFRFAKTIGLITTCSDREQIGFFDDVLYINDDRDTLCRIVKNNLSSGPNNTSFGKKLSNRELDVLKLLIKGHSNKQIADELFISVHTVITHRKNIIQKLGIKSTAGLAIYGVIHNIIDIDDYLHHFNAI